jgi:hypothetical protein
MKSSLLPAALIAAALAAGTADLAQAQSGSGYGETGTQANTRAARRAREAKQPGKAAPLFPNATREEPKQSGNAALSKPLAKLFDAQQEARYDEVIAGADALLADARATAYDKATAAYLAGYAWLSKDTETYTNAITYLQRAIDENGLSNNTHYQMMLQVAQMQVNEEKYADAATSAKRYLDESKSDDPRAHALIGNAQFRQDKFAEAAAALEQAIAKAEQPDGNLVNMLVASYMELDRTEQAAKFIEGLLAKKPDDKAMQLTLATVYQQAGQDAKAGAVFDRMRAAGQLTEPKDYKVAYRLLANIEGRQKDAIAFLQEGIAKGILSPDFETYSVLGQLHYDLDQIPLAIEAWSKAAPLAKDGEMYLNLGKLQISEQQWTAGKASGQQALARGVKRKGDAWVVIGNAELGLKNKAGALAAYREAAKYPETKRAAESALRQAAGQ